MKKFFRIKTKKTKSAIIVSLLVVAIFGVMQAMETKSATTDQINLSVDVASAIAVVCPDPSAFAALTAGTPVATTATCTTTTNSAGGYTLAVKRDDADTTLDLTTDATTNIADKTEWTSATPNAAVWSGTGLGFRVKQTGTTAAAYSSTWWGTDDTAPNALYAGLPSAYDTIVNDTTYSASPTTAAVEFKVDVTSGQATGTYDGTATFQVTAIP